eukprot:TRINITY_DN703_c0_g1_i1.p1 TRINITY_DN703_c0_g1~~TRINITY_DN703_c0_g1_i1.p1  ORF type:complete len:189 (+),score=73.83 TRINITY_DN703_c0_g1_i1:70-567(+)
MSDEYATGPVNSNYYNGQQPQEGEVGERGIVKKVAVVGAAGFLAYQGVKYFRKKRCGKKAHGHRGIEDDEDDDEWVDENGNPVAAPPQESQQQQYDQTGYQQAQGYPQYGQEQYNPYPPQQYGGYQQPQGYSQYGQEQYSPYPPQQQQQQQFGIHPQYGAYQGYQ